MSQEPVLFYAKIMVLLLLLSPEHQLCSQVTCTMYSSILLLVLLFCLYVVLHPAGASAAGGS
jgi:hypothetical protein